MKKSTAKHILIFLMLTLVLSVVAFNHQEKDCKAAGKIIYTAMTGSSSSNTGNGTKSNPYNLFETALANATDGDTIYILEPMGFLNASDNSPCIINKSITIKGDGTLFMVRASGIVLGADVTFDNVVLSFGSRYHDGIFANGHTLTLNNVSCESGARKVDVFGGGLYINGMNVTPSGNEAQIIMSGGGENFGNIYAGSLNGDYTGNVTIFLTSLKSASNSSVNVSGADEPYVNLDDLFNLEEPAAPTANKNHTISGNVNITMSNCNITKIEQPAYGVSAACNLTIQTNGAYIGNLQILNMDLITVKGGGTLAPTACSSGTSVVLDGGSGLDMSYVSTPILAGLTSQNSASNKLILEQEQYLEITDSLSGSFVFETADGYNGHSGMANYDFVYIRLAIGATSTNAAFSFTCIPGMEMTLDKVSNYTVQGNTYPVVWKTSEEPEYYPFAINGLEFINPTITVTQKEFANSPVFYANVTAQVPAENQYFDLVPMRYEITYNNVTYQVEAEFDGISYVADVPALHMSLMAYSYMEFEDAGINVYTYVDGSNNALVYPSIGVYKIVVLPLSEGEQITKTIKLIITDENGYYPEEETTEAPSGTTSTTEATTEKTTDNTTESSTEKSTQKSTDGSTQKPTQRPTKKPSQTTEGTDEETDEDTSDESGEKPNKETSNESNSETGSSSAGEDVGTDTETDTEIDTETTENKTTKESTSENSMPKYVIGFIVAGVVLAMGGVVVLVIVMKRKSGGHND